MATELSTDIAAEVNISARRNDTFKLVLEVKDSNQLTMDLSAINSNTGKPVYQAKMSIMSLNGEQMLNIYSYNWHDSISVADTYTGNHPFDRIPSATLAGFFTGGSSDATGAINLVGQVSAGDTVSVTVPYTHMAFQSGKYKYDLQLRKNPSIPSNREYTTWLYGSFTLKADITQI